MTVSNKCKHPVREPSSCPEEPVNKSAFCGAGFHCWKKDIRMVTCFVWRCEWCGKRKVTSR